MAGSHTPFVVLNRVVNPLVRGLLRSPAHGLLSGRLALLSVTGRRSGRTFTFPVGYHRDGDRVTISVASPERKRWWRNLSDARGDERTGVTVELELDGAPGTAAAT